MNEDKLKDLYDRAFTHDDPHSPWFDGPDAEDEDDDLDCCLHGVPFCEECERCNDEEDEVDGL